MPCEDVSATRAQALCFQNGETWFSQAQAQLASRKGKRVASSALAEINNNLRFQNLMNRPPLLPDPLPWQDNGNWTFKWGLFLPDEVQKSKILCDEKDFSRPQLSRSMTMMSLMQINRFASNELGQSRKRTLYKQDGRNLQDFFLE